LNLGEDVLGEKLFGDVGFGDGHGSLHKLGSGELEIKDDTAGTVGTQG
jgi:hypothetical protein